MKSHVILYQSFNDFLLIAHVDCSVHLMCQHCEDSSWYAHQVCIFFCSFLSLFQICSCIWADCVKKDVFATQLAKKHDQILLIHWHICYFLKNLLDDFFCIFSTSSLFAIFIMTLCLLQSNDDSSLKRCFLVDNSSLVMFAHNMIFNEKRVFLCICNCLLSSWINVFSFYMFFVMNASWVAWCFSSDSSQR